MSVSSTNDRQTPGDAPSSVSEKESPINSTPTNDSVALDEVGEEPKPHLHAKTFLAVFAVFGIYFAQVYCLVGAGAVSVTLFPSCVSWARQLSDWPHSKARRSPPNSTPRPSRHGSPGRWPFLPSFWGP